jgi:CRP-like cAMP-binding protein
MLLMETVHRALVRKLREHSTLTREDLAEIRSLTFTVHSLAPNEDFIRQGDAPHVSAVVLSGIVARYHLLADGRRQYLSFHMRGDLPDAQTLFLEKMDHAVSAIGSATIAAVPHREIEKVFERRPNLGFAIWKETLIDAAIFREAITNNSARSNRTRMAHLFCEIFYRASASGLVHSDAFIFPLSLRQLGETLGIAIASVNRSLQELRTTGSVDFRNGKLTVKNWRDLARVGHFDPLYLHLRKPPLQKS